MAVKDCEVCEKPFSSDKEWERLCLVCWKESRSYTLTKGDQAFSAMREEYISLLDEIASLEEERDRYRALARKGVEKLKRLKADEPSLPPERLKQLIKLCHPDKHGGSEAAEAVTKWLLSMRG